MIPFPRKPRRRVATGTFAAALCFCPTLWASLETLPPRAEVIAACIRANDYWIANHGGETNPSEDNRWDPAAYYTGNQRLAEVLDEGHPDEAMARDVYLNRAVLWSEKHGWARGPEGLAHADAHACGQTYLDLYRLQPEERRLNGVDGSTGIKPTMDYIVDTGSSNDDWWWIDAFYMAGPTLAKLDQTVGEVEGRDYSARLKAMYLDMRNRRDLFDEDYGLWYRDNASKRTTSENGLPEFWGRGNGWVIAGLVRVMDEIGPAHPDWAIYEADLRTMVGALIPLQQADGFWRASLADPADSRWDNPETSATAFITYAIAWGINAGVLDEAIHGPVVELAWNGLVNTALHPDGRVGYVQDVGRAPASTDFDRTTDFGVGTFLLAGAEVSLLAEDLQPPIVPWAGMDREVVDDNYDGRAKVLADASLTTDTGNRIATYEWLVGEVVVATGIRAEVPLPLGSTTITLRVTDLDGAVYTESFVATVRWPKPSVSASTWQDPNVPASTLDGDPGTRWSAEGDQWIAFDLHMPTQLNAVSLAFFLGDERRARIAIHVSVDGTAWTEVFRGESSGNTTALEKFDFPDLVARYVRIDGTGNTENGWNSFTEVELDWELTNHDGDGNGLPDAWEQVFASGTVGDVQSDVDGDGSSVLDEWIRGYDPQRADGIAGLFMASRARGRVTIRFDARAAAGIGYAGLRRLYTIEHSEALEPAHWQPVPGAVDVAGDNSRFETDFGLTAPCHFFRLTSRLVPTPVP